MMAVWCELCDQPHLPCEPPEVRYQCHDCDTFIECGTECVCEWDDHCQQHCPSPYGGDQ